MKIYDISHTMEEGLPAWPGDWAFYREFSSRIEAGQGSNSSNIRTALHCGNQMDAPRHTIEEGLTVDQVDLSAVIGPALVITVKGPEIVPDELTEVAVKKAKRVILRCPGQGAELRCFPERFPFPGPAAARFLVEAGVVLVGTNTPSVDPPDSVALETHRILMTAGIVVLENLFLEEVPDGEYQLIALPLKIAGGDGSPVRAVLVDRSCAPSRASDSRFKI
jgi:arylformamidase